MRSARPFAVAFLLCLSLPLGGCGDKPSAPASVGGYKTPESLIQALRAAVQSGDAATASKLYDSTDPIAATKAAFWGKLAEQTKRWGDVRTAYMAKFGAAAWSTPANSLDLAWTMRDLGLDASLSEYFSQARIKIVGDEATMAAGKFQLTVNRKDGAWRTFREETFGLTADELKMFDGDPARAKAALDAIAAAATPAEVEAKLAR